MTATNQPNPQVSHDQPVSFPIPDFDRATTIFGAPADAYLTRQQLGDFYGFGHTPYHKAAEGLFHKGGRLADYGLAWKAHVDQENAMRALNGLLGSWAPKHEVKIGTVAFMLREHCDVLTARQAKKAAKR